MEATLPLLDPVSFQMWKDSKLTWAQKMKATKALYGQLPNAKLEHRWGWRPTPFCTLCAASGLPGVLDGTGHVLGGCQHAVMRAHYIERHNEAVRRITAALLLGRGDAYVVADAGAPEKLPRGVHSTRLPAWLLPDTDPETLAKMRPDILLVTSRDAEGNVRKGHTESRTVDLFEVGYCCDTKHAEKAAQKADQHRVLASLLRGAGWTVHYRVITLGHAGTIPTTAATETLAAGAPAHAVTSCMRKLARHAVEYLDRISRTRQTLAAPPEHKGKG
jgi:hypothetical protein